MAKVMNELMAIEAVKAGKLQAGNPMGKYSRSANEAVAGETIADKVKGFLANEKGFTNADGSTQKPSLYCITEGNRRFRPEEDIILQLKVGVSITLKCIAADFEHAKTGAKETRQFFEFVSINSTEVETANKAAKATA